VVKQDSNGDTFIVTDAEAAWIGEAARHAHIAPRDIGAWEPDDYPDEPLSF
jgi:hypothetical protein